MSEKEWDEDESGDSSPPNVPVRRNRFDDEKEEEIPSSWSDEEDSEVERERAKKAAQAKAAARAKTAAEALAKSKPDSKPAQQNPKKVIKKIQAQEAGDDSSDDDDNDDDDDDDSDDDDESDDDEDDTDDDDDDEKSDSDSSDEEITIADPAARKAQLKKLQTKADLAHAADLFGDLGVSKKSKSEKRVVVQDSGNVAKSVNFSSMPVFKPKTKDEFVKLRDVLVPLLVANSKQPYYGVFVPEFVKMVCQDLPSDQIRKIASSLTASANEKMKEEKTTNKTNKKTKASKTKISLTASRDLSRKADLTSYDDDRFDDNDFM